MGYAYPTDFSQASRARTEIVKIQAGLELDASKQDLQRLSDLELGIRQYVLRVFDAFAAEVLEMGRQGRWTVDRVDREAREFLACLTLEAQIRKGHYNQGQAIAPLVDRVFGQVLPEVRREFERSDEWLRYQQGLLDVARVQGSGILTGKRDTPSAKTTRGRATDAQAHPDSAPVPEQKADLRPQNWEDVEIEFLSDERIQIWVRGRPETLNYAEFGCVDKRSERPNSAWRVLRVLAETGGSIPAAARVNLESWPATEKQVERLRAALRSHFNLFDDPLPFMPDTGYRARFKIRRAKSADK